MSEPLRSFRLTHDDVARKQRDNAKMLTSMGSGGGGPHDPNMEARVLRLEEDVRDVKVALGRLEPLIVGIHAQIPHLATQAELKEMRGGLESKIGVLRGDMMSALAGKPGIGAMWTMGIALFALVVAAMAVGAIYLPLTAKLFHVPS